MPEMARLALSVPGELEAPSRMCRMKWILKLGLSFCLTSLVAAQTSSSVTITNAGLFTNVTVTWTTPFADANYTAQCTGDAMTGGVPEIEGIDISAAKTASVITVRTIALTAAAARFTTIDCMAMHD
jgi:hypothetical protein